VAFVRTKRVGDHEYRQLVENYRENGHHRQRVLAHLGQYGTVEEAIEGARQRLANLEASRLAEQVQEAEREVAGRERSIRERYGKQLAHYHDGEIPTPAEVKKRTGTDKQAPTVGEVEEKSPLLGFVYKVPVYAGVPIPPEVDEYSRAFGDGSAIPLEEYPYGGRSPDKFGHTVYYPGLSAYERRIDLLRYWRERADEKRTEYERRSPYHRDRIEKLEQVARSLSGD
jgi:hypothetical protein